MKKSIIYAAIATLLTACGDGSTPAVQEPESKAQVKLNTMSLSVEPEEVDTHNRSTESVDVSAYTVTLTNTATGTAVGSWKYSAMPTTMLEVSPGAYRLDVASHAVKAAAWEEPLYAGSESFSVEADAIHAAGAIVCKLSNVKVTVVYSPTLQALMSANSAVTVSAAKGQLTYSATETRAGYFQHVEGSTTLTATFSGTIQGREEQMLRTITDLQPGHHYIITFTVKEGGYIDPKSISLDASVIDATINVTLQAEEDAILDDSDRPGGNGGGEVVPPTPSEDITFTSTTLSFTDENLTTVPEAKVDIHATHGIEHLQIEIISDYLTDEFLQSVGLAANFDLAEPGDLQAGLSGLGFPTGDEVRGHTDLTFDITQFLPLIFEEGIHKFRLIVTDAKGNVAERTLTFRV